MINWLLELFTLEHLGYFALGVATSVAWHYVKAHIQGHVVVFRWNYIAIPLVVLIVGYIAMQNQQNADCVREFSQTLKVRSQITAENDRISIYQRELVHQWINALVFSPPSITDLPSDDPIRQAWAIELTKDIDRKFKESIAEQRANDAQRAANPLPPPTCGL